jgi:hypothetical protein
LACLTALLTPNELETDKYLSFSIPKPLKKYSTSELPRRFLPSLHMAVNAAGIAFSSIPRAFAE